MHCELAALIVAMENFEPHLHAGPSTFSVDEEDINVF